MRKRSWLWIGIGVAAFGLAVAQPRGESRPSVSFELANSAWPIYHQNRSMTASVETPGPVPGDRLELQRIDNRAGGPSPWTLLGEPYPDGSIPVWGATTTQVVKYVMNGDEFRLVDKFRIDRDPDVHWNCVMLRGNRFITVDQNKRQILIFADERPSDPDSPIRRVAAYEIPKDVPGEPLAFGPMPDGTMIVGTDSGWLLAYDRSLNLVEKYPLQLDENDVAFHNAFPIDETGAMYMVSDLSMKKIRWNGDTFQEEWRVPYDFRGPEAPRRINRSREIFRVLRGQEGTGSGTTPTLMGVPGGDEFVLVLDGHTPNNAVLFWRDEIPADWAGLPGQPRRIAAVQPMPYSTPKDDGFTSECSPTAHGYSFATAQWNGIFPVEDPVRGVQKFTWNPRSRLLEMDWATEEINMNGVLTYSQGSNLVYQTGYRNGRYWLYGLDWDTGEVTLRHPLANDHGVHDGGNNIVIAPDRSLLWGSKEGIARVFRKGTDP